MRAFGPPCLRDAGAPRQFTDERDREGPRPGGRTPGSTPLPTSPLPGGRREDSGGRREDGAARLPVRRLPDPLSSPLPTLTPPPFRGEVGKGVPPLGAPASRRPRAKRERECGPSARHAGGTPAHPGSSRMSGVGKAPVRAAEPPGQPLSRPPPFQGGGEKTQGGGEKTARPASPFDDFPIRAPPPANPDSSPLQGGGREGGPAAGCAGVPPASREARTRVRAFGPPCRRDAGAPRQFTDERGREDPRPGGRAPGATPLPTSPLKGGRREDPGGRRADGAARLPVRPSRAVPKE